MKKHYGFASILLSTLLACSSPLYAHDAGTQDSWQGSAGHNEGKHDALPLPEEKKKLLHQTMKNVFEKDKPFMEEAKGLHKQMHDILAAKTFDQQAFINVNEKIEKIHDKMHSDRVEAFASIASQFTPKEREMIARHFAHHPHHGHHMGWKHGQHGSQDHMGMAPHDTNAWRERPAETISPASQTDDKAYPPYPQR